MQVPHEEHRNLHLLIFKRLENPFVTGILEAYWEAYEAVGLNVFAGGYEYLQEVWRFHQTMVESICNGNFKVGYEALVAHTDLLYHRPQHQSVIASGSKRSNPKLRMQLASG